MLDGTKPLPEPVLTYRRLNSKTVISKIVQYISNISIDKNLTECILSSISSKMLAILFKSCDVKSKYTSFIRWSDCQSTDTVSVVIELDVLPVTTWGVVQYRDAHLSERKIILKGLAGDFCHHKRISYTGNQDLCLNGCKIVMEMKLMFNIHWVIYGV